MLTNPRRSLQRQALLIVGIYACAAGAWITLSDPILGALVSDPKTLVELSIYKGIFFVAATAALLYVLLRRTFRTIEVALAARDREEQERRRTESLADREGRFARELIAAMPGVFYLYDENGKFLRWNPNFERITGYSGDELGAKHPLDFFTGEEKRLVEDRIREVYRSGDSQVEASLVGRDGTATPHFFTGRRIVLDGKTCLVGVGVDIAERKRAEAALAKSEERYRTTLDNILEGCQLLSHEWQYLYLNGAAAIQNRRPNAELLGRTFSEAWPGIEASPIFALLSRCMTERTALHDETEFVFLDGSTGWFDVRAQPVPEGIFILSIDISERKRAELELRHLNESLEQIVAERTRDLAQAVERAESADRVKSAFLATMSHELRTPLNSILGFTGIILQELAGPLVPEQKKQLGMVQRSARHLLDLINDILDISKIEAGQIELRLATFDLRGAVAGVLASVAPNAAKKGLELGFEDGPPLSIESDRRRVEQVLLNLVNNAIKFTDKGSVKVALVADHDVIRVHVRDTGMGIKPDDLACLFQPFRQIDTGLQRQHEGTGLGLAISARLIGLLGGTIRVDSVWGGGSTFTIELAPPRA